MQRTAWLIAAAVIGMYAATSAEAFPPVIVGPGPGPRPAVVAPAAPVLPLPGAAPRSATRRPALG